MSVEAFAKWMQDRGSFREIRRANGEQYLDRHFILKVKGKSAYLHRFWKSDDASLGVHDHPWTNVTIVLKGEYIEHYYDGTSVRRKAGDIVFREARTAHRIEIEPQWEGKVWSLFLTAKRFRDWGFYTKDGWVEASKLTEVGRDFYLVGWLFPRVVRIQHNSVWRSKDDDRLPRVA